MNPVSARDLVVLHGSRRLVGPVSFDLPSATSVGIQGPSGAGKSTLLRALLGLLPAGLRSRGEVALMGRSIETSQHEMAELRSRIVLVGQVPVVFPCSVAANVVFGLRHHARLSRRDLAERAREALNEAGLWDEVSDRLDAPASQLSVGQRQRLCLARALALDPVALLLDEPTSALDASATARVEETLDRLRGRRGLLLVSHDRGQLHRLCDRVIDVGPAESTGANEPGATPGEPVAAPPGR